MEINEKTIDHLAHLARLEFSAEEKKKMTGDLQKILSFVEQLDQLDTDGITPMVYVNEERNKLRDDVHEETYSKEAALKNAPEKDTDYIKVRKVLKS
jgi:aspartyl-tRNA(Asn)/glutamyl-tRNA(Gln) amidotransferase subunit C